MTIKKSNIEIPGEWLEKIELEKKPQNRQLDDKKIKQIEEFLKLKYPDYSLRSIAKACGVCHTTVLKIFKNM